MTRISVIVPNLNSGAVLNRCLTSLHDQNYPELEVIVVDALSSDDSLKIIEKQRAWIGHVISARDDGQADGLNKGFRHATGEIFGWLCADDELAPGALNHVGALFDAHREADVVLGACERRFADGSSVVTPARSDTWNRIHIQNVIDQPSMFWRKPLHQRLGELDATFRLAFDWDFWCRMRNARASLQTTGQILSVYHFSGGNQSSTAGRRHADESFRILRRYGPLWGLLAYIFRFLYLRFDLHGCYDRPPTCSRWRARSFAVTLLVLRMLIGKKLLYSYNWHFASCQERNLQWW